MAAAGAGGAGGGGSGFFKDSAGKKGEVFELKADLNSSDQEKKLAAVKKVIAAMTVGKDVSMLFVDVLKCMQTDNLELKKMVYLYLMNYAKSLPDLAILAVSTFTRDCEDKRPLIRALAIRTMGCIRVDQIVEYLCEPLRKCLQDTDPYVRKTAAVCVAKLYDVNPEMCESQGFLDILRGLVSDPNSLVVSNAVAALAEISESSPTPVFTVNTETLNNLLAALGECTEWGQIFILDALVDFVPRDSREAEHICERILPRLQHANPAVVLSAVKVVLLYMNIITTQEFLKNCIKKLAPPLVSLLSSEPEIQYVALRNIDLIVQAHPLILRHEIKRFFCKYNDPLYVKMEKLEVMIKLVSARNVDQVLLEFKEYAQEVDVAFVRKAVRAIGRTAIQLPSVAEKCISVLRSLIQTNASNANYVGNYVVQEVIVAIKDIFRRYPNQYESIISELCANLESLDEPEALASMIWIVGEYSERIENAPQLLAEWLDEWKDMEVPVRLALLTATVKCFLKKPSETQPSVTRVLQLATEDSRTPDLRDRAYVYWRLLSTDPEAAKVVVLSERPVIRDTEQRLQPGMLALLLKHLSCLASVYHKPPSLFTGGGSKALEMLDDADAAEGLSHLSEVAAEAAGVGADVGARVFAPAPAPAPVFAPVPTPAPVHAPMPAPAPAPARVNLLDL